MKPDMSDGRGCDMKLREVPRLFGHKAWERASNLRYRNKGNNSNKKHGNEINAGNNDSNNFVNS